MTYIGTGLKASVHVKVPKTAAQGKLNDIFAGMDIQPRGTGGVYDISNKIAIWQIYCFRYNKA